MLLHFRRNAKRKESSRSSRSESPRVLQAYQIVLIMNQSNITKESWHVIGSYLGYADSLSLLQTCRDARKHLDDNFFWQQFILGNCVPSSILPVVGSIDRSKAIVRCIASSLTKKSLRPMELNVISVSSFDRREEGPQNTLAPSNCYENIQKTFLGQSVDRRNRSNQLRVGFYCQRMCGCLEGTPCYWSSAPSPNSAGFEYVSYKLASKVSLIAGFSITPYQAYMHPNAPVYGPQDVCIQFLKEPAALTGRYGVGRLSEEQLNEGVYYQSKFFEVKNIYEAQTFTLPAPMLCVSAAVRVVYRGMHQRQLLGPGTIQDYYLCISRCAILEIPVSDFVGTLSVEDGAIIQSSGKMNITCSAELQRRPSFAFNATNTREVDICEEFVDAHLCKEEAASADGDKMVDASGNQCILS